MEINIKLSIEQWNQVLDMLSDASVKRAMPLINAMVAQAKEQMSAEQQQQQTNGAVLKE